jgi:hypothetical protein
MAIGTIIEDPQYRSAEEKELLEASVRSSGPVPPEGARLVVGGPTSDGWRVIGIWDSREARDRFYSERLTPAYEAAGLSFDDVSLTEFEVELLVAGDLVAAA